MFGTSALPQWFLTHCVYTAEELKVLDIPLDLIDPTGDFEYGDMGPPPATQVYEVDVSDYKQLAHISRPLSTRLTHSDAAKGFGERFKSGLQELRKFFSGEFSKDWLLSYDAEELTSNFTRRNNTSFTFNTIHIYLPADYNVGNAEDFFLALVRRFARDSGAALVTLDLDDLRDLAEHFSGLKSALSPKGDRPEAKFCPCRCDAVDPEDRLESDFGNDISDLLSVSTPPLMIDARSLDFDAILNAPQQKHDDSQKDTTLTRSILVLYLPDIYATRFVNAERYLSGLREALRASERDVIIISSSHQEALEQIDLSNLSFKSVPRRQDYDYPWNSFQPDPPSPLQVHKSGTLTKYHTKPPEIEHLHGAFICLAPVRSPEQVALLDRHQKQKDDRTKYRRVQRVVRQKVESLQHAPFLQPFTDRESVEYAGSSNHANNTSEHSSALSNELLLQIFSQALRKVGFISNNTADTCAEKGIGRTPFEDQVADTDTETVTDAETVTDTKTDKDIETDNDIETDTDHFIPKWQNFPPVTRAKIKEIEDKSYLYEKEFEFLDLLVDPTEDQAGWANIIIPDEVKDALQKVTHRSSQEDGNFYGILKRAKIGGALLYGPPGTGKTHLARVLAHEVAATTICISGADLQDKYVGETEKAIKALFNLARMLTPSIIFIDEADSLFQARNAESRSWERSTVNQLLHEMDGLKQTGDAPFVLLASNHPSTLDTAVLRRVAQRIHVGLPTGFQRRKIFEMYLKDEVLDGDVNLMHLSARSAGYSGSDILNVCVQAALQSLDRVSDTDTRRLLKVSDFETAFRRCASTCSEDTLLGIRTFAQQFDPTALETMRSISKTNASLESLGSVTPEIKFFLEVWDGINLTEFMSSYPIRPQPEIEKGIIEARVFESKCTPDVTTSYSYTPLNSSMKEIRVIHIEPSKDDGILRCKLSIVSLNNWTSEYGYMSGKADAYDLSKSTDNRRALWETVCRLNPRMNDLTTISKDEWDKAFTSAKFQSYADPAGTLEAGFVPRYNWGDYVALSYAWGSPQQDQQIIVNGYQFAIGKNLLDALIRFRDSRIGQLSNLYIWADALCINQDDLNERALQVKLMREIYSQCLFTWVWLGATSVELSDDLTIYKDFLAAFDPNLHPPGTFGWRKGLDWQMINDFAIIKPLLRIAASMADSPWWTRLWTLQEHILAPSILFVLGRNEMNMRELMGFMPIIGDKRATQAVGIDLESFRTMYSSMVTIGLRTMFLLLYRSIMKTGIGLYQILEIASVVRSTDARDKVYGLLGLIDPKISARIHADYHHRNTAKQVFIDFSKAWLEEDQNLDGLALVRKYVPATSGLPSWVVDLDRKNEGIGELIHPQHFFSSTSEKHEANINMRMGSLSVDSTSRILSCAGVIVDRIGQLLTTINRGDSRDRTREPEKVSPEILTQWKLTLSRVLQEDPKFQFGKEKSSILDIPWMEPEALYGNEDYESTRKYTESHKILKDDFPGEENLWKNFVHWGGLAAIFPRLLWPHRTALIGGLPLRDYFTSTDTICTNVAGFDAHAYKGNLQVIHNQKLVMTEGGLLGQAPKRAEQGDVIAVLASCSTPVVLRQKDGTVEYEIICGCYVEGLMNGEVAAAIERGDTEMQTIKLC